MSGRHRKSGPAVDEPGYEAAPAQLAAPAAAPVQAVPVEAPVPVDVPVPVEAPVPVGVGVGAHAAPPAAPEPWASPARPLLPPAPTSPPPFAAPVGTGAAAEAEAVLPVGSSARRAAREQQRARSRRTRIIATAAAVAMALVAVVGGYKVLVAGGSGDTPPPAAAQRPQSTLLLQVVDGGRQTVAAVLLGHDTRGGGTGYGSLIPSALAVDAPGSGSGSFGATSAGPAGQSAVALSDVVGVTVDGTWVLDQAGVAALVDAVGGVDVDVDHDVTVAVAGGTQTVVTAGHQHLSGAQAAAFATFLAAQEPEQSRLARFSTVLSAVLPKLPSDAHARAALLTGLGAHSTGTVAGSRLDTFLGGLRSDAAGNRMAFDTLPTRSLDLGTGVPSLLLDPVPAAAMVKNNFSGSLPATRVDGPIRVVIQNGVGTPGLVNKARSKVVVDGITYVSGGNADHFGYPHSLVLVTGSSGPNGQKQAAAVAKALGLPAKDIALTDQGQTIADVVVILGPDFKP